MSEPASLEMVHMAEAEPQTQLDDGTEDRAAPTVLQAMPMEVKKEESDREEVTS